MRTANPDLQNRRRLQIINAAEQAFLNQGFHQTSMQTIAAASGLSMGLLYRYFTNKEAIIAAVAQQDQDATLAAVAHLPETGEVVAAWVSLIVDMARLAAAPDYARLANEILAEANRSPKILATLQANDAALAAAIVLKLSAQHQRGVIKPPADVDIVAQVLLLLFEGLTMRHYMTAVMSQNACRQLVEPLVTRILMGATP